MPQALCVHHIVVHVCGLEICGAGSESKQSDSVHLIFAGSAEDDYEGCHATLLKPSDMLSADA